MPISINEKEARELEQYVNVGAAIRYLTNEVRNAVVHNLPDRQVTIWNVEDLQDLVNRVIKE